MKPQVVMTMPLLVGLDGSMKMSKSLGNYIAVNDSPKDVFGKSMSIPDNLMANYFNFLTNENGDEIQKQVSSGKLHPRDAKVKLAKLLTELLHGKAVAENEAAEFDRVFSQKQTPKDLHTMHVPIESNPIWIIELLRNVKFVSSGAEARRLVEQGAIELDGIKITNPNEKVLLKPESLLKAGKTKYIKILCHKY